MIAEAKYILRAGKTRVLSALLILGLIAGGLPIAAIHAAGVTVTQASYVDGAGGQQGIDVYSTGGANKPGIIFVHGGGWRVGDKNQYAGLGHQAAELGYVAASINYRLGSAGVYYQYEDVMRAVQSIRQNAGQYGMDPNRIAIWGDSAGGSLAMRIAASGQSGLAAAVGWSAPVNAYTAIFNSLQSFAIGLDHSTCIPTDPAALSSLIPTAQGGSNTSSQGQDVTEGNMLNLLSGTAGKASNSGVAPGTTGIGSNPTPANSSNVDVSQVVSNLAGLAQGATGGQSSSIDTAGLSQLASMALNAVSQAAGTSSDPTAQHAASVAGQLAGTMNNNSSTPSIYDPKSSTASAEVKAAASKSPLAATATHTAVAPVSAEVQRAVLAITDAFGCQDNFRVLSPALNFAPNTPPTFLANAQDEFLVHPGQAIEYSNNLRAAGIDSSFLILPGANHMGFDDRAVQPTFEFLAKHLRP